METQQKLSFSQFCKQLMLHPVAFLDTYFPAGGQTPDYLKKNAWFIFFRLSVYIFFFVFISCGAFYALFIGEGLYDRAIVALGYLLFPLVFAGALYLTYSIGSWLFRMSILWAGEECTPEKSTNLYIYYLAHMVLVSPIISTISIFLFYFIYLSEIFISLFITLLGFGILFLYPLRIKYLLVNKATGISVGSFVVYFVIFPYILTSVVILMLKLLINN